MTNKGKKYRKKDDLPRPDLPSDHSKNRKKVRILSSYSPDLAEKLQDESIWTEEGFDNRSEWVEHHLRDVLDMN